MSELIEKYQDTMKRTLTALTFAGVLAATRVGARAACLRERRR